MMTVNTATMLGTFCFSTLPLMIAVFMAVSAIRKDDWVEINWMERACLLTLAAIGFMLFILLVVIGIEAGYPGTIVHRNSMEGTMP